MNEFLKSYLIINYKEEGMEEVRLIKTTIIKNIILTKKELVIDKQEYLIENIENILTTDQPPNLFVIDNVKQNPETIILYNK